MGAEKLAPTNYHHVNLHDDFFMPGNGFVACRLLGKCIVWYEIRTCKLLERN